MSTTHVKNQAEAVSTRDVGHKLGVIFESADEVVVDRLLDGDCSFLPTPATASKSERNLPFGFEGYNRFQAVHCKRRIMPTRGAVGGQSRRVDGVIDEEKLSVLETCALGWVKEVISIRVLVKEMVATGLDGFEIMWVAGSMVLLAFPDANSRQRLLSQDVLLTWFGRLEEWSASAEYASWRSWLSISGFPIHLWSEGSFRNIAGLWGKYLWVDAATEEHTSFERARILIETFVKGRIDAVVEVASLGTMFPIVVQEAELVRVPAVEQRGVVVGAALSEQSQEASVASPRKNSPVEQGHRASVVVGCASDRVVCDRGGVYSEGDADFAFTRIRSREGLDIVHPSVPIAERDSLGVKVVGDCESAEKYGRVVGVNGEGAPSTTILGLVGAAAAPVIGSAHGGARKVKSVNTLVEALGSPAQKRVIAAARSRRGRRRPAKVSRVEEAGGVMENESLTGSDIQAR
ncbi:hypothetical protein V6N11_051585 [Hibiscus sabdariffa]|uniref:DUF4283 domain-containing protein n=1 Tax=Hibiscus sabdariffa TaxID=183260 RepID=A0ABR2U7K7_9ROSI